MDFALSETASPPSGNEKASYMERLLTLLETAASLEDSATASEVATQTGIPVSSASRLLNQLTDWRYLQRDADGSYAAGIRLIKLAMLVTERLSDTDELRNATERLSTATGESVTAGLLVHDTLIIVARTDCDQPLRAVNRVGELISPTEAALGKAVLSHLPSSRRLDLLRAAGSDRPEAALDSLSPELAQAEQDGYAVDEETFTPGLRCRAAPILDRQGRARGGISIGGPSARFTLNRASESIQQLISETNRLSISAK